MLSISVLLQGVKGPMLKQTKPSKLKLPIAYIDLLTEQRLPLPDVLSSATSIPNPKPARPTAAPQQNGVRHASHEPRPSRTKVPHFILKQLHLLCTVL